MLTAIGPRTSCEGLSGRQPSVGSRPKVVFRPVVPHRAAGSRTLPEVSLPRAPRKSPEAMPAPLPVLDPPVHRSGSQGLRGTGKGWAGSGRPMAYSAMVVLPRTTAPARRSRATAGASSPRHQCGSWAGLCAVAGPSKVARLSFTASGSPCSGPRSAAGRESAARAAASACSGKRVTYTPSSGSSASASASAAATSSRLPTAPDRRAQAASVRVAKGCCTGRLRGGKLAGSDEVGRC